MNDIDPRDVRLRSQYYTPAQLVALGRIVELSALLEVLLRQVLAQVMGISQAAAEALFLGDRVSNLVARIKALGKLVDMPKWFSEEAVPWATRVDSAIKARDSLLHRPPVMLVKSDDDGEGVLGWNRARRDHQLIPVDNGQLLDVIERLANLEGQAKVKLGWWGWNTSVTRTDTGDDAGADGDPADCPPCE